MVIYRDIFENLIQIFPNTLHFFIQFLSLIIVKDIILGWNS